MMSNQIIQKLLQNKKHVRLAACALLAVFGSAYFFYYYSFANRYERIALAQPQQLESVKLLRYYSPEWYGMHSNWDRAQTETGQTLAIIPKPMGVFTSLLVPALPIPSAYRVSGGVIGRSEQADGSPMPVNINHPPVILQINRQTGHVCYQSNCAKLSSICAPYVLMSKPKGPGCQFIKH
jgi:hypothetical protein